MNLKITFLCSFHFAQHTLYIVPVSTCGNKSYHTCIICDDHRYASVRTREECRESRLGIIIISWSRAFFFADPPSHFFVTMQNDIRKSKIYISFCLSVCLSLSLSERDSHRVFLCLFLTPSALYTYHLCAHCTYVEGTTNPIICIHKIILCVSRFAKR